MEINRSGRTDGEWNDLPLRPNPSGALDVLLDILLNMVVGIIST